MEIHQDEDGWRFAELDALVTDLLRQMPACALLEDDSVQARLFSSPTQGGDGQQDEEWQEFVVPGLRELFQGHVDIVRGDLARLKYDGTTASLTVPTAHGRAWIHALNQARLALAAKHGMTEDDIEARRPVRGQEKAFALLQIDFYGMLLGIFLRGTEL